MNTAAQALGRLGAGKKKTITAKARRARIANLAKARARKAVNDANRKELKEIQAMPGEL